MRAGQAERIWAWEEYGQLEVGDVRRRDRVVAMASRLAGSASGQVSKAFEDRAERQGAYDLLESGRVSADALIEAAGAATVQRSHGEEVVYVAIDGTSVNIVDRNHSTDLGVVGTYSDKARGLQVITALSVSREGKPQGICAQKWWVRPVKRKKRSGSKYQPVEKRESRFMVETIQDVAERYAGSGSKPWAIVDRAGDATVVLDELFRRRLLFTVRASWNRRILRGGKLGKVRDWLRTTKVRLRNELPVPEGYNRPARLAKLDVKTAAKVARRSDPRRDAQHCYGGPLASRSWRVLRQLQRRSTGIHHHRSRHGQTRDRRRSPRGNPGFWENAMNGQRARFSLRSNASSTRR